MRSAAIAPGGQPAGLLRELLEGAARDGWRQASGRETAMRAQACTAPKQELFSYHDRTIALLKRYFRMSLEIGRMPSVLGREVFRARVTSYRVHTFEDAVIFVHDVEKCLEQLDPFPANSSLASSCRTTATKKRRGWSGAARGPSIACFL